MIIEILERLQKIDALIYVQNTGTPDELAKKLNVSVRSIYDYLKIMKELNAPIRFDKLIGSYCYKTDGRFTMTFIPTPKTPTGEVVMKSTLRKINRRA